MQQNYKTEAILKPPWILSAISNPHTDLSGEDGTLPLKAFQHHSTTYNESLDGHKDIQEIHLHFNNHHPHHHLRRDISDCTAQGRKNPQIKSTQVTFKINKQTSKQKQQPSRGKKSEYGVTKQPKMSIFQQNKMRKAKNQ